MDALDTSLSAAAMYDYHIICWDHKAKASTMAVCFIVGVVSALKKMTHVLDYRKGLRPLHNK